MGYYDKENIPADILNILLILALIGAAWYGVEKIINVIEWIIKHIHIT